MKTFINKNNKLGELFQNEPKEIPDGLKVIDLTDEQYEFMQIRETEYDAFYLIDGKIKRVDETPVKKQLEKELYNLKKWFDNSYAYQEQKYRRLIALNKLDDDGVDTNEKLIALYDEAEMNRLRIQELEELINNV